MDKIAVLIPCYNESKTVEKVVSDFRRVLPDATVYVYDNNSTDGTAELAAGAGAVVRHGFPTSVILSFRISILFARTLTRLRISF